MTAEPPAPVGRRIRRFAAQPLSHQAAVARDIAWLRWYRARRLFIERWHRDFRGPGIPLRLREGAWWITSPDEVSTRLFSGVFEPDERRFVTRFLGPGMVFADVGAHHGLYSVIAARRVASTGEVVAFEPSPRERHRLARHTRLNRVDVEVVPAAVGASSGTARLDIADDGAFNTVTATGDGEPVEMVSLDDFFAGRRPPDLVKVDAEGCDPDVLAGATGLLDAARPVVLCELSSRRARAGARPGAAVVELLRGHRYRVLEFAGRDRLTELDADAAAALAGRDGNVLATPAERAGALVALGYSIRSGP